MKYLKNDRRKTVLYNKYARDFKHEYAVLLLVRAHEHYIVM